MTEAQKIDRLATTLKIIHTWASVPGALVPEHVRALINRTLEEAA